MSEKQKNNSKSGDAASFGRIDDLTEYMVDAAQRTILFWDVMRQRGNAQREHAAKSVPHVLDFEFEPLIDGRKLERPVNYGLVRSRPAQGCGNRRDQAAICHGRSAGGPRSRDRWLQGRQ